MTIITAAAQTRHVKSVLLADSIGFQRVHTPAPLGVLAGTLITITDRAQPSARASLERAGYEVLTLGCNLLSAAPR